MEALAFSRAFLPLLAILSRILLRFGFIPMEFSSTANRMLCPLKSGKSSSFFTIFGFSPFTARSIIFWSSGDGCEGKINVNGLISYSLIGYRFSQVWFLARGVDRRKVYQCHSLLVAS